MCEGTHSIWEEYGPYESSTYTLGIFVFLDKSEKDLSVHGMDRLYIIAPQPFMSFATKFLIWAFMEFSEGVVASIYVLLGNSSFRSRISVVHDPMRREIIVWR